jgi:hypothetical protein
MQVRLMVYMSAAMLAAGSLPANAEVRNNNNDNKASVPEMSATEAGSGSATTEKKVCKKLTVSGSRVGDRVCLTADQWKKVEAED